MRKRITSAYFNRARAKSHAMLKLIVWRLTPTRKSCRAVSQDELLVEAEKALLYSMIHFDPECGSFQTYLYSQVKGRVQNTLRDCANQLRGITLVDDEFLAEAYEAKEVDLDLNLLIEDVTRCLGDVEKKLVLDTYIRSKPLRVLAQELGMSHGSVYTRLLRAIERMRERFPELISKPRQATVLAS